MVDSAQVNLVVQGGPNSGRAIPLSGRPVTMGRRADNDVLVDHTTVSRRHALVMETPGGFVLRDLNSTNGTFVNNSKVGMGDRGRCHGGRDSGHGHSGARGPRQGRCRTGGRRRLPPSASSQ